MRPPRELLIWGLWLGVVAALACGLLFAILSAVFAVINTAASPNGGLVAVPGLFLWNSLAMIFQLAAVCMWTVQYFLKLKDNVMSQEDLDNLWKSKDMASLGYSYWFVVGAVIVHILNIVAIYIGVRESRHKNVPEPISEEKANGAIMLY